MRLICSNPDLVAKGESIRFIVGKNLNIKEGYDFSKFAQNLVTGMGEGYAKGYVFPVLSIGSGALF